jgi:hypothetical protein
VCSFAFPLYRASAAEFTGARFAVILPLSRHFQILYPDDSRGFVNTAQKEQMLRSGEIAATNDARTFAFIGKEAVLHSFQELGKLFERRVPVFDGFYPGLFVWELGEKRSRELLESPEAMALRLGVA